MDTDQEDIRYENMPESSDISDPSITSFSGKEVLGGAASEKSVIARTLEQVLRREQLGLVEREY
ncbi:MAG: hypothetical protein ACR2LN_07230 [Candidatus Levyibacteriota bacterium]